MIGSQRSETAILEDFGSMNYAMKIIVVKRNTAKPKLGNKLQKTPGFTTYSSEDERKNLHPKPNTGHIERNQTAKNKSRGK